MGTDRRILSDLRCVRVCLKLSRKFVGKRKMCLKARGNERNKSDPSTAIRQHFVDCLKCPKYMADFFVFFSLYFLYICVASLLGSAPPVDKVKVGSTDENIKLS